jgi:hypothetical protein
VDECVVPLVSSACPTLALQPSSVMLELEQRQLVLDLTFCLICFEFDLALERKMNFFHERRRATRSLGYGDADGNEVMKTTLLHSNFFVSFLCRRVAMIFHSFAHF